ncbi:metal ABC transporter substrate-binding protein [Rhodococcus sp. F64268]|uniref:metal ABC transporter substrate-binding protein n=1 Tax=Rhodococcus sp. F64268 TaxID=2926402 RepID=UPI001FF1FD1A|nr:metal ABC transporter substrate-binding protein [Rhodococcus sp. F64268]MCK0092123.1 metal ABC transporter substrate-binding protein [Rhodococcus sp. F64268]
MRPPKSVLGATSLAALVALTACGTAQSDDEPLVLTTFTVLADMTRTVAGDHVRVESITKPGAEVHGYEPTPGDLRHAAEADLVLDNGLGLERWFEQFLADTDAAHVVLTEGVEPLPIGDDSSTQLNPHAWMSPLTAQIYVDNIEAALSDLAPEHAADFAANADAYRSELQAVHDELTTTLAAVPEHQRALVTCEGAFGHLVRDAGMREAYLWPVNSDQQGTPQQIARTVDFVRENDIPAVFCESTVSDKAQRQVAADTGAAYGGTLYVDSLSDPDGPVPTYLELLRHDVATITSGLNP